MVNLHLAYTAPINPAGVKPVLTTAQVYAGLDRKIYFPQEFVPVIESCEVIEEKDGVVVRDVVFKAGGPKKQAREWVRSYWPAWHDFEQEDGSHVRNIISDGPSGEEGDLLLTYTFQYQLPHLAEGSKEAEEQLVKLKGVAKNAVNKSIDVIRKMVIEGKIEK
ncbi:DUF1857-domain-containing protein [Dothidotthia symphoricarpi CBS 119687]|uniref:DUF1857-domain-containing protein n=1 Tax=Dothidotthia symphoricarpi CBS 119687 TaxID=1392245 RepID=A0A6A6A7H2_9PLEO|nr:DUF1857-domain-containing protein [Dothidotthia symphoricarpi CBS 119687]KAF2127093.1 DUF1857-domain-containing protein [Dothidotthia symphoricarpi CBS 119687]